MSVAMIYPPTDYASLKAAYVAALQQGLNYNDMIANIEAHADSVAERFKKGVKGSYLWRDLDAITAEAKQIQSYRKAFVDFIMEELRLQDKQKKATQSTRTTPSTAPSGA